MFQGEAQPLEEGDRDNDEFSEIKCLSIRKFNYWCEKIHQSSSLVPVPDCETQIFLVNIKAKGRNKILLATHLLYNQPSKWCQQREHRAFHEPANVILKYKRSEFTDKIATSPFRMTQPEERSIHSNSNMDDDRQQLLIFLHKY